MIGIIGFGRFGQLTAKYLVQDFEVRVYNRSDKSSAILELGATPSTLADVCRQKVVLLAVPISRFRDMLQQIAPLLQPGALVVDVCSVKVYPTRWMRELLPETVSILATHPMFGPDSAAGSLAGRKIFLWKERVAEELYRKVKDYLAGKDLVLIETTPEDHDRQIAVSLSLTHFIGRGLAKFGARSCEIDTEGYRRLLHILGVVTHDTWQLFTDMHRFNPYARQNRQAFIDALKSIDGSLAAEEFQEVESWEAPVE